MNCFSEIFFSSLSQQKLMRKKFFCCKKILLILNNQKMKNLQNLNLVELNAQETKEIEGGLFGVDDIILFGAGVAIGLAPYLYDNRKKFWKGFYDGVSGK